jgi:hypothetical protein
MGTGEPTTDEQDERDTVTARSSSTRSLTYLAIPYSHPDPAVREARFVIANREAGRLMRAGAKVFSPISHTHPIAVECELPKGWDFWQAFDRAYLSASERVVVVCIDGWRESVGVQAEIAIAQEMGIPVEYITPESENARSSSTTPQATEPTPRGSTVECPEHGDYCDGESCCCADRHWRGVASPSAEEESNGA